MIFPAGNRTAWKSMLTNNGTDFDASNYLNNASVKVFYSANTGELLGQKLTMCDFDGDTYSG